MLCMYYNTTDELANYVTQQRLTQNTVYFVLSTTLTEGELALS